MMTLRCTRKLLERVGVSAKAETAPPTTVLGDWYAKVVYASPQQLVLCMNEQTRTIRLPVTYCYMFSGILANG
jgi:hypothetical protein